MENLTASAEDERLAEMLHALGNPMRLAIIHYVANNPGCICNDLVVRCDRAQATVSQHLATLRRANVLTAERDGPATCYRLDTENIAWLQAQLQRINSSTPWADVGQ